MIFYHMMRQAASYSDLGGDFFERLEPNRLKRYYVQRLERLGYTRGPRIHSYRLIQNFQ